jgi:hypothetical protein
VNWNCAPPLAIDRKLMAAARGRIGATDVMDGSIAKLRRPRFGGELFTLLDDLNNNRVTADDNPETPSYIRSNRGDRRPGIISQVRDRWVALFCSAPIDGGEVTLRVNNRLANSPEARRLYPTKLPRRWFAVEAVKGHVWTVPVVQEQI